ncbi:hypothetical protein CLOM_g13238 [Closterium sp. NIES-68]|nr:hypothetical protein CLOM_g13238 [Closterium sp. NIES-68]
MTALSSPNAFTRTDFSPASSFSALPRSNLNLTARSGRHGCRFASLSRRAESSQSPIQLLDHSLGSSESSQTTRESHSETSEAPQSTRSDPLLDALAANADADVASFHFPAHRRGLGAPPRALSAFGADVFRHDLPELPDLDNLFAPESVIAEAQERAARVFGASETRFLVNGSTVGVQAAIVACCRPGDVLILPRNAHQCAFSGMVLSGAVPHYILPVTDHSWGITHGVTLDSVTEAIRHVAAAGARIGAVLVVSPTYYGVCSDIRGIARACHEAGAALIVDEAHGAHFKFHSALPETALEAGADIVVQSTHKVLGSMTQSAMLHIGLGNAEHGNAEQGDAEDGAAKHGDAKSVHGNAGAASPASVPATSLPAPAAAPSPRVSPRDIARALQLLQSSSPSYLLLASLDATVGHISLPSFCSSLARALRLASRLRSSLQSLGLRVLSPGAETDVSSPSHGSGSFAGFDPLRVAVSVREMGMTGYDVDDVLLREHSVVGELPSLHGIMFAVSTGTTDRDVDRVVAAFAAIVRERGVGERVGEGMGRRRMTSWVLDICRCQVH